MITKRCLECGIVAKRSYDTVDFSLSCILGVEGAASVLAVSIR